MCAFSAVPRFILFVFATTNLFFQVTESAAPNVAEQYFYTPDRPVPEQVDPDHVQIIEYIAPTDRSAMAEVMVNAPYQYEDQPAFLYAANYPHHRVVSFYLPFCNICRQFQPKNWIMAQRLHELLPDQKVEFYAISCSQNRELCSDQEARIFPSVKVMRPNELGHEGRHLIREHVTTLNVLDLLGLRDEVSTSSNVRTALTWDEESLTGSVDDYVPVTFVPRKKRAEAKQDISIASAFLLPLSLFMVFISGSMLRGGKKRKLMVKMS